ncbi:hypothetical protein ACLB2K_008981 [Fragaria x ananassa]
MNIQPYFDGAIGWWISNEGAVMPLVDELIIQFLFYKQTLHIFGPIKEEYNFLQRERVIKITPSELRTEDITSIMQSPSMRKIKQVIDIEFPSSETAVRLEVEERILQIVQNPGTPILVPPNHRIFVKAIDGIKILHDTCDKSAKQRIHDHLEATRRATCAICTEDVNLSKPSRLPCLHLFHHCCIMQWLEIKHQCPTCRSPVPDEFVTWF